MLIALAAHALGLVSACGGAETGDAEGGEQTLVVYKREGGIRFRSTTLSVSAEGKATVRSEGCVVRFPLSTGSMRRLRATLEEADLSALAGDHPAPPGAADVIAETIVAGQDRVRIGDFTSLSAPAQRELSPLSTILGEILMEGEQQLPQPC